MNLGPRTQTLFSDLRWRPRDAYPSDQCFADELERLLNFAAAHGEHDRYTSKLCSRERDSAIAELRVGYDLADRGFRFDEFEPLGLDGKRGEFLISPSGNPPRIFTEVKAPDWHAEVTRFGKAAADPERLRAAKERLKKPKYRNGSGGAYLPGAGVEFAIEKAYEKLPRDRPTLVIVPSDYLFNSYEYSPQIIAQRRLLNAGGPFSSDKYERLGGVGLFWFELRGSEIKYDMEVVANPHATSGNALPPAVASILRRRLPKKEAISVWQLAERARRRSQDSWIRTLFRRGAPSRHGLSTARPSPRRPDGCGRQITPPPTSRRDARFDENGFRLSPVDQALQSHSLPQALHRSELRCDLAQVLPRHRVADRAHLFPPVLTRLVDHGTAAIEHQREERSLRVERQDLHAWKRLRRPETVKRQGARLEHLFRVRTFDLDRCELRRGVLRFDPAQTDDRCQTFARRAREKWSPIGLELIPRDVTEIVADADGHA